MDVILPTLVGVHHLNEMLGLGESHATCSSWNEREVLIRAGNTSAGLTDRSLVIRPT